MSRVLPFNAMRRLFALFMVVLMALAPAVAMAGYSPAAGDAQEMPCHSQGDESPGQNASCGDMNGCCMAVLIPAFQGATPIFAGMPPVLGGNRFLAGFVPDKLDPPPVAL